MKRLFLVLPLVFAGCSNDELALDDFPEAYSKAICDKSFKCCTATDLEGKDAGECKNNLLMAVTMMNSQIKKSESQNRMTYHGDEMQKCIDAINAAACDKWPAIMETESSCKKAFESKTAAGAACGQDMECVDGYCLGASTDVNNPQDGVCTAFIASGSSCNSVNGEQCVDGLYCSGTGACDAQKNVGDVCTSSDECIYGNCLTPSGASQSTCQPQACYQGCAAVRGRSALAIAVGLFVILGLRRARARAT